MQSGGCGAGVFPRPTRVDPDVVVVVVVVMRMSQAMAQCDEDGCTPLHAAARYSGNAGGVLAALEVGCLLRGR